MSAVYQKLREFLDQFPLGFPASPSGLEIEILKRLFTPEEAEIAVLLTPIPEEAAPIAARAGRSADEMAVKLADMAQKGLIFRVDRGGLDRYSSAPFMIGIYEYSVKRIDRELAELYKRYYDEAYQDEMGVSDVPGFKVIPLKKNIEAGLTLLPYEKLEDDVRAARVIAVTDCICRKEAQLTGHGCHHPLEACLSFGVAAEYYIRNGSGRRINADEALEILRIADASGLVHAGANSKHLSNICNCCPCCCASMKGMVQKGHPTRKYMNPIFEAVIDQAECTACGTCVERCPVKAITVDDVAAVDRERCLGCGLCAGECPVEAIALRRREDAAEPFERVLDMSLAILEAKKIKRAAGRDRG